MSKQMLARLLGMLDCAVTVNEDVDMQELLEEAHLLVATAQVMEEENAPLWKEVPSC